MSASLAEALDNDVVNLTIRRANLLAGISRVQSVVERRNTIPILGNVKLELASNMLSMTATDMDLEVTEKVECTPGSAGSFTLPALMFYDIVRKLPEGEVALSNSSKDGKVTIKMGSSKFTLPTLPSHDFPSIADEGYKNTFTLPAPTLASLFEKTSFAMSTEETRYYLNGIYFHIPPKEVGFLRTVATDGHRLAKNEIAAPIGTDEMPGIIIPRKAVLEVLKIIDGETENIEISVSENKIKFNIGSTVLVTKIIDGNFPDYDRVIPSGNDKIMEVNPRIFASAVDRVSTISADKVRAVRLNLENGKLTLTSSSPDVGVATDTLDVSYSAAHIEMGFNARYIMDVLNQIDSDTVQFVFADSMAPVLIRDTGDVGVSYVIMPMRI